MAGNSTFTWRHALDLHSTLSPFDSPFPQAHSAVKDIHPVSWKRYNIAGLLITIYGLEELPSQSSQITCLWLLHGRGDTQDSMSYTAAALLQAWTSTLPQRSQTPPSPSHPATTTTTKGLLCISFDQRNHGSRLIDDRANVSWKQGNPTHAQDMFATYSGTASDLSHLITNFSSYFSFASDGVRLEHLAAGISLGGHAVWQALVADPRIKAGIIIVGCPDYIRLMTDRAIRAKLESCMATQPAGRMFLGSKDFPASLVQAVEDLDPAGLFLGELDTVTGDEYLHEPSDAEKKRLMPLLRARLAGKKILCLSGGKDRLVPYEQSEPFMTWLKTATAKGKGWAAELEINVQDVIDPEAGHEFSPLMRAEAERWLCEYLSGSESTSADKGSKL